MHTTCPEHAGRSPVVVVGQHPMVAQSVVLALRARGHDATTVTWPESGSGLGRDLPPGAVGLLLGEVDDPEVRAVATEILCRRDRVWTVLANVPPESCWGALLEAGAHEVLPPGTSLETVSRVLRGDGAPGVLLDGPARSQVLAQWRLDVERSEAARTGLAALTSREREVLASLHGGSTVHEIALLGEVSEATVRTQVKSVLRKLMVGTQLAAVARYELVRRDPGGSVAPTLVGSR